MERIVLAREYGVAEWLRNAYLELCQKEALDLDELRPAEPHSESNPLDTTRDWEADAKKWKAISRDWETLARTCQLQTKVATSIKSIGYNCYCYDCGVYYGATQRTLCKCRLSALADEVFQEEMKSLKENPKQVTKRKLPISYLYSCKSMLYRQGHLWQDRSTAKTEKKKKESLIRL